MAARCANLRRSHVNEGPFVLYKQTTVGGWNGPTREQTESFNKKLSVRTSARPTHPDRSSLSVSGENFIFIKFHPPPSTKLGGRGQEGEGGTSKFVGGVQPDGEGLPSNIFNLSDACRNLSTPSPSLSPNCFRFQILCLCKPNNLTKSTFNFPQTIN
jgi:hypothetical protein